VTDPPSIAVIIGAFRPRPYLRSAVNSVLVQTLGRDRVELQVTLGFEDRDLMGWLANANVPARVDGEPRIGPWLLRAVAATRAPLVAFLDDDDEFEPDRLAHVVQVFREHPEVGFYRNRVSVLDGEGHPVPPARWRSLEQDASFDTTGPVVVPPGPKEGLLELATERSRVSFTSSTMVVRRELLQTKWAEAFSRTQLPDLSLFLSGALGPYGLYLDDRRLTRYRFHSANVTHRVSWLAEAARCHREGAELARTLSRPEFASWLAAEAIHYERLYRGGTIVEQVGAGAPRSAVARLTGQYLRFLGHYPEERRARLDVWAPEMYGLAYCLVPPLARRMRSARAPRLPAATG
jgi:hypothetical protein